MSIGRIIRSILGTSEHSEVSEVPVKKSKVNLIVTFFHPKEGYNPVVVSYEGEVNGRKVQGSFHTNIHSDWGTLLKCPYEGKSELLVDGVRETSETTQLFVFRYWEEIKDEYEHEERRQLRKSEEEWEKKVSLWKAEEERKRTEREEKQRKAREEKYIKEQEALETLKNKGL